MDALIERGMVVYQPRARCEGETGAYALSAIGRIIARTLPQEEVE